MSSISAKDIHEAHLTMRALIEVCLKNGLYKNPEEVALHLRQCQSVGIAAGLLHTIVTGNSSAKPNKPVLTKDTPNDVVKDDHTSPE